MKPINGWIALIVFAMGGFLAWIVRRGSELAMTTTCLRQEPVDGNQGNEERQTKKLWKDPLERASTNEVTPGKTMDVTVSEEQKSLEDLIKQAGIDGLEIEQSVLCRKLLFDWYKVSPDAALHWVLNCERQKDTKCLLSGLIGLVASEDLDAALALAERYGAAQGRELFMPSPLRRILGKQDTKNFLRIIGLFSSYEGSSGPVAFSDDLNFRAVLDRLIEMQTDTKKEIKKPFIPSNLLSEWAKRDWNAAWEWVLSGKEVPENNIASLLSRGAGGTVSTDELAGLAVRVVSIPNRSPEKNYVDVGAILASRPTPELVASFLEQAPGGRQENLTRLLAISTSSSEDSYKALHEILLSQMSCPPHP